MPESKPTLGKLLKGDEERDAIHIAIAPVVAGDRLKPGQRVGLDINGVATRRFYIDQTVGIVDPFLDTVVEEGQSFYLFLYPNTITSLRHEWEHPSFPKPNSISAEFTEVLSSAQKESIRWMKDIAHQYASYQYDYRGTDDPYEWLMEEADKIVSGEESYITFNVDCYGEIDPQEFWRHYQIIRQKFVNLDTSKNIFSCSC